MWRLRDFQDEEDLRIVVGALIVSNDDLLFIVRGEEPRCGYISVPEGHVRRDEGLIDALSREVAEEIRARIKLLSSKALVITGRANALLDDMYAVKARVEDNSIGMHRFWICDMMTPLDEPPSESDKHYVYALCKLVSEPQPTRSAPRLFYEQPYKILRDALKLKIKMQPTTLMMLKLLAAGKYPSSWILWMSRMFKGRTLDGAREKSI